MHLIETYPPGSEIACSSVVEWFLMEYLSDWGLDLTVEHIDLSEEGTTGWCMKLGRCEFIIQIHKDLKGNEYTSTILHELYHVYQHLNNLPQCEICAYQAEKQLLDKYQKT
tara:strand:+ start:118 stop:450 length:333 start_codon:yes stop_codon:yes gene_type:complete